MNTTEQMTTYDIEEKTKAYFETLKQEFVNKKTSTKYTEISFSIEFGKFRFQKSLLNLKLMIFFSSEDGQKGAFSLNSHSKKQDFTVLYSHLNTKGFFKMNSELDDDLKNMLYFASEYFWKLFYGRDVTSIYYKEEDISSEHFHQKNIPFFRTAY